MPRINPLADGLAVVDTSHALALVMVSVDPADPVGVVSVDHCGRGNPAVVALALREIADRLDPRDGGPSPVAVRPAPVIPDSGAYPRGVSPWPNPGRVTPW